MRRVWQDHRELELSLGASISVHCLSSWGCRISPRVIFCWRCMTPNSCGARSARCCSRASMVILRLSRRSGRRRDRRDQSDYSPGRVHPYRRTCMPFHRGRAVRRDFRRPATIIAPRTVPHHRIPNCLVGGLLTQRHFNCGEVVPSRVEGEGLSLILKTSIHCRMFPVLVQ